MPDAAWWYETLEKLPPSVLTAICIIVVAVYYFHIKKKNELLSTAISNYEIAKGMNKEHGQITVFPNLVIKTNTAEYKYSYDCTLHINAVESFPDGFNMTITLSKDFKVRVGQNSEEKSTSRKPKHCIYLNSDYFKNTQFSSSRINSLDFFIYSNQRKLDLDINIDFGFGAINSRIFLSP